MSSVSKTLELLTFFSVARPEVGLTEMCRMANRDKATTHRHLQELENAGFVEQNALTKQYRLGPAVLSLAQTREVTVPRKSGAVEALRDLSDATGETAHAAVLSGTTLYVLAAVESPQHSTRVIIDIKTLPLHATASGLCALAFGPDTLLNDAKIDMHPFTDTTLTTKEALQKAIKSTKQSGFARSPGSYESDAHSLASPIFDQTGLFAGSVSVASVATRMTPDLEAVIKTSLITASRNITRNWGGKTPAHLHDAWARSHPHSHKLDAAS